MRDSIEGKLARLRNIYNREHRWGDDQLAVPKNLNAVNPNAKLVVVGEAVGPRTLRLSGVSYFTQQGTIGSSGRYLDDILANFGYTVYPSKDVTVPRGVIDAAPGRRRTTAYFCDICPVFPGSCRATDGKLRIRRPTPELITSALRRSFLEDQLRIVRPKVILLLGKCAYQAAYTYLLKSTPKQKISQLNFDRDSFPARFEGAVLIPMLHPSPASPTFIKWFNSRETLTSKQAFVDCVVGYLGKPASSTYR